MSIRQNRTGSRRASVFCAAALVLLPALYFGSYRLLLDQGAEYPETSDPYVIFPPEPKPCIREQYVVGEGRQGVLPPGEPCASHD